MRLKVLSFLGAMIFVGCSPKSEDPGKTIPEIQAQEGVPVSVMIAKPTEISHIEIGNGTIKGGQQTMLANAIGGTVGSIRVKVGQYVKKGAVVATMVIDGGSPIDVASSNYNYAKKLYNRAVDLQKEGAVSQEQVEGAKTQYEAAKIKLGQAKVGVNITAPFAGKILEIYQTKGSKIKEKSPVVKIANLQRAQIEMQVNERAINDYKVGQKAFVEVGNDTVTGIVKRVALSANEYNHSFKVTIELGNRKGLLTSGMFKNVSVIIDRKDDALVVPFEVVKFEDNRTFLYVVDGDKAVERDVETGIRQDNNLEITEGLSDGDRVVVMGSSLITDGTKIKVVTE